MASSNGVQGSSDSTRKGLRQRRTRDRELVVRHRWFAGGIATMVTAALLFGGVTAPAVADEVPSPAPTDSSAPTPAPEESSPPADEAAPPAESPAPVEETAPPVEDATTPADDATAPAGDPAATPAPIQSDASDATTLDAADEPDVGILTVPDPGPTTAVITVKVGSDRTGITGVTPLAGVVLLLNTGTASPSGTRPDGVAGVADGWAKCTSDAQGDCSFSVPNTQAAGGGNPAGVNRDARYWVVQSGVPAGYFANPVLRTGDASGAGTATPYQFRTGQQLRANNVYSSQDANDFMLSSGATPTASGGIWQQSRVNPTIAQSCGINVALILDLSGSVAPTLPQLKQAADTFVDALQGTPSRMALFSFSTATPAIGATQNYPALTSVSTADQATNFKNRYAAWTASGYTNWDRGLGAADAANSPVNDFDLAVVITDGNPTAYNQPAQGLGGNRFREIENGIFSANGLKQGPDAAPAPTRVLAFGVGAGATGTSTALNLRAISGPTAYNGTNVNDADYFQTTDYPAAGEALRDLALGNCEGTLTVTKQIVPSTAPAGSIDGAVAAGAGWEFTTASNTAGVTTPAPVQTTTADGTGAVNFPLTFAGGVTSGSLTVAEAQQTGFTLQPVGGFNATCLNITADPNTPVPVTNTGALGFTVNVPSSVAVSCTVYNRAPVPPADLTVDKNWIINGVPYANGAQPSDFSAQLQLTGPGAAGATDQGWGVTRTGYEQGDTATISELQPVGLVDPTMCTNSATVTNVNGAATNSPLGAGYQLILSAGQNTATITNTVVCRSTLTLVKQVQGGAATPDSWTLNAQFLADAPVPAPALPGFDGPTGTTDDVTPNARYQLFEDGGDPRYVQTDNRTSLQSNPLSTGSATCIRVNADGTPFPNSGYSDGINGGVNVPLGYRVACTFVNQTASLTLLKNVVNDDGGTESASAWDLTGTPAPLTGLTASTVVGSETPVAASTFQVRPNHVYTLTESDVTGYEFAELQQFVGGVWVDVVANADPALYPQQDADGDWQVTVGPLNQAVYRFVNDDFFDDVGIVKTATGLPAGGSVEPGDSFDYVLTVTNNGSRAATNVRVTDDDLNDRLEITGLTVTPALTWGPLPGYAGNVVDLTIDSLAPGASATITVSVTFLAADAPPVVPSGTDPDAIPEPLDPLESLTNTACVEADFDGDPTNDCADLEIPVRDIAVVLYTRCVGDAPLLGWVASKSAALSDEAFTFLWTPGTPGNPAPADTDPAQVLIEQPDTANTWSDEIEWVGTAFTPSGVSLDYPGWRPIEISDVIPGSSPLNFYMPGTGLPMTPQERADNVFNGLILDPSELNYAWRNPTTATISVNPEMTFEVEYPDATPECFVARHTEVQVEKTASVKSTDPGKSFTYTLAAQNVSDDSAAEGVVITDAIPADVKITDVSWPGEGSATAFPNWSTCGVTGQSAFGYGGTLRCELFGVLQPAGAGLGTSAAPTITLAATVNPGSAAMVVTNVGVVDYYTFGDPGDPGRDTDDAVVTLGGLPATGGGVSIPLVTFGILALLAGLSALVVSRTRRGRPDTGSLLGE
ncbi:hypothetical protein ACLQ2Q_19830 [Microbacterium sp. DT81.1]|uniref:hypothetical protein n=1 Tax=Microbacterium sp. DT81.1 TaxID=3393413 RepID=UPI003CEADAE1